MIASCCNTEATAYRIPNPFTGEEMIVYHCEPCRREYQQTSAGPKWIKSGLYCQDPECHAPLFRMVIHPRTGYPTPLWPDPNHLIAEYAVLAGPKGTNLRAKPHHKRPITRQSYCGPDCAPDLKAKPHHGLEEGGAPHRYRIGGCVRVVRAKDARDVAGNLIFASNWTPERGEFLRLWLAEELRLAEDERARLLAQWALDSAC